MRKILITFLGLAIFLSFASQVLAQTPTPACFINTFDGRATSELVTGETYRVIAANLTPGTEYFLITQKGSNQTSLKIGSQTDVRGFLDVIFTFQSTLPPQRDYTLSLQGTSPSISCTVTSSFAIRIGAPTPTPTPTPIPDPGTCKIIAGPPAEFESKCNPDFTPYQEGAFLEKCVCKRTGSPGIAVPTDLIRPSPTIPLPKGTPFQPDCKAIDNDPKKGYECQTAIGPIRTSPKELGGQLLLIILGFAGGTAIFRIIYAGYQMMTAAGNPEHLQEAKETLTAAIIGLLFIIFSVVILRVIGFEILRIPGFGP